ncbi:thioredoxin family protein [Flavicella sediminum]|uniref:thioredoxin family protein n=1 Tax=Flavicella sediminum TaxID=2585141 RepID=UPI00111E7265|nr:thioredoxin family protein [Flavicella sediminum]
MHKVIKILGTGCSKCQAMTVVVNEVISENKLDASLEKVEDLMEIMKFDVMTTPALVINDVVSVKGRVPSKNEVLALLND